MEQLITTLPALELGVGLSLCILLIIILLKQLNKKDELLTKLQTERDKDIKILNTLKELYKDVAFELRGLKREVETLVRRLK
jgi:hypothetical protein